MKQQVITGQDTQEYNRESSTQYAFYLYFKNFY